jgi:hypothetical protein
MVTGGVSVRRRLDLDADRNADPRPFYADTDGHADYAGAEANTVTALHTSAGVTVCAARRSRCRQATRSRWKSRSIT